MIRNIQVPHGQIDEIGKGIEVGKARGSVLHDLGDAVSSPAHGVSERIFDEVDDETMVRFQSLDKPAKRRNATAQHGGHPGLQELLGPPEIPITPKVLELVLPLPRPVDAVI